LVAFFAGLAAGFFAAAGFLAFGFAAFFAAVFVGVLAFLGLAAFGFTVADTRLQPSLRNQQLIQNTAKWLVKQLLH
jgi:Tfp pilus assembly protein PilX